MLKIDKKSFLFLTIEFFQMLCLFVFYENKTRLSYFDMSVIGIIEYVLNVILLKILCGLSVISIPNIFALFSFIFHCGQIIKEGFSIKGTVPLLFENYANASEIQQAFFFYLFSQIAFWCAIALFMKQDRGIRDIIPTKWEKRSSFNVSLYGIVLICIGILPRLYIDILSLIGANANGYEGVYSIYFPQAIQSLAFFFDAGLFFLLFGKKNTKYASLLFWGTILYKCLVMTSGGRQEKVAFLLIWIYVYYFVINKISVKKIFFLGIFCVAGFWFVSAIGIVRTENTTGISQTIELLQSGTMNNVFGSALGEFGSAFVTLEVAYKYVPLKISYGYGRTFLAGCLSVVPLLIKRIPWLSETVIFLTQLPKNITFAMGGSYLGELYYNFSWFGILGSAVLGAFIIKLHNGIVNNKKSNDLYKAWCAILSTAMMLYVRGYFTDMMQKLVWTYLGIYLIYLYMVKKSSIVKIGEGSI